MTSVNQTTKMWPVVLAAAVIVVLAGTLGARLIGLDNAAPKLRAPAATVPEPAVFDVTELEVPCWTCPENRVWALRFQTNLDLLAPLGNGTANAAEWFALFEKRVGPRADEAVAAQKRGLEGPEWLGTVLPPDDPLLLEAEPWCDQATMSFYPDIFPLDGYSTRITNLLFAIKLVRSWVARGEAAEDGDVAMADFRRAIRLGRLLRQEDTVVISDLVGLACIHIATRAVYDRALADGDLELALLASVVIGEVAPQRLGTKKHLTSTDLLDSFQQGDSGEINFRLQPGKLDVVIEAAESAPDRRFRCEAVLGLNIIRSLGAPEEIERANDVLDALVNDADRKVAVGAQWCIENPTSVDVLEEWGIVDPKKM
jgi:hypothetical protein